jgi:hypothetical protein
MITTVVRLIITKFATWLRHVVQTAKHEPLCTSNKVEHPKLKWHPLKTLKFSTSSSAGDTRMYTLSSVGKPRKQEHSLTTLQAGYLFIQSLPTAVPLCNISMLPTKYLAYKELSGNPGIQTQLPQQPHAHTIAVSMCHVPCFYVIWTKCKTLMKAYVLLYLRCVSGVGHAWAATVSTNEVRLEVSTINKKRLIV